jgi:hypothetical protein
MTGARDFISWQCPDQFSVPYSHLSSGCSRVLPLMWSSWGLKLHLLCMWIIIIIIGQSSPFWAIALEDFTRYVFLAWIRPSSFHFFACRSSNFFYRARSSSLHSSAHLEDQVPVCMSLSDRCSVIPPGTGFPFCLLLWLAGYSGSSLPSYRKCMWILSYI